ncbi:hypothetical protein HCN44_003945 [Aphidius gifuensis]|uniref:Radial spoke head protein 3 homolog n=1 Tax=Aphidius gifuensis TaxID=684658 RepID=A0A835CUM3_APHGI|nr:bromodomain-containing protein DDB_G0280777 [Aphidius gifuensis]XP_044002030.1 bromodomain-containing protein DDB_G0280777 [Aphidius gifuensis]KAF7994473.1 hypothetical protein HCN44_003945 [Aphidius gifuensis]
MPTGVSNLAQFNNAGEKYKPAFKIINRDNLQTTLPIIHFNQMNSDDINNDINNEINNNITKINNKKNLNKKKCISRSNDHLVLASLQNNQKTPIQNNGKKKIKSKSHDNLINIDADNKKKLGKKLMNISTENFNDVLNAKLRKIQEQEENEMAKKINKKIINNNNTNNNNNINMKKPFITTVKSGEFLMPPPEVAALLGMTPTGAWIGNTYLNNIDNSSGINTNNNNNSSLHINNDIIVPKLKHRSLITIGKRPEIRHSSHNARCPAALKATIDFSINHQNNNNNNYVNSITAKSLAQEERLKHLSDNKFDKNETDHHSLPFGNIMYDKRVIRGSTYASSQLLNDGEQSQAAKYAEMRRKGLLKKKNQLQTTRSMMLRIKSPPPVAGRKHEPVQTELYLEELFDKPSESEVGTQTDYFLDRPSTPPYCPGKIGTDVETQIDPGDLFDYDTEVQPILEVLVGKTIEQALIEVLEEEELAALREQQRRFLELRAAEKVEHQRLEQQDRRIREEKNQRLKQHEEAVKIQQETEERVAAAVLLTGYIAELLPTAIENLKLSGYLIDDIKPDIQDNFMPWLTNEVKKEIGNTIESREILMDIVTEVLENRAKTYHKIGIENESNYVSSENIATQEFEEESGGIRDRDFHDYKTPNLLNN